MTVRLEQIPSDRMDSNSYLLEENGHVIIVDGSSGPDLIQRIEAEGWTADYLLLTHEHFDHIWYLEDLRDRLGMPVVACRLCSDRIQDVKANLSNISDVLYYFKTGIVREGRSPAFTCRPAEITYEDHFELDWQGHRICFARLPGHSPGSVIIQMDRIRYEGETASAKAGHAGDQDPAAEESCVFTGDYLIREEPEILRLKDGSPEDYEAFARPVLEAIADGTMLCPGHGPVYRMGERAETALQAPEGKS